MSKARKAAKKEKKAALDAKQITTGKILRTFLKVFVISILFTLVLLLVETFMGWKVTDKIWIQMGFMFIIVIIAQPFIMSEFRPPKK